MTISQTLYSGFTTSDGKFDAGKFVEAVLLFDTVLIANPSIFSGLLRSTGVSGFLQLLKEKRIVVVGGGPSAQGTFDYTNPGFFSNKPLNHPLRFGFETIYVDPSHPNNLSVEKRLLRDLEKIKETYPIKKKQFNQIYKSTLKTLRVIDGSKLKTSDDFRADIQYKQELIVELLIDSLSKSLPINSVKFNFSIEEKYNEVFQINTNLGSALGISDEKLHELLKKPFFEITGTNLQLHRMRAVEAAAGLTEEQAKIISKRLDFISKVHTQSDTRPELTRIVNISKLPTLEPDSVIDVKKLILLRDSKEACAFRDWIQHSQMLQDQEIEKLLTGWRSRVGETLKTKKMKKLRWLTSTGISSFEPISGTIISAMDLFLDKFLPDMGPIGFIVGDYNKFMQNQLTD